MGFWDNTGSPNPYQTTKPTDILHKKVQKLAELETLPSRQTTEVK